MAALRGKFTRIGACKTEYMAGKFDDGNLHTEANAQIGNAMLPGILSRQNHAFDAAASEAARDKNPVKLGEQLVLRVCRDRLRVDPLNVHLCTKGKPGVPQGLRNGQIGIVKLHVFSHKADAYRLAAALDGSDHRLPLAQIRLRCG